MSVEKSEAASAVHGYRSFTTLELPACIWDSWLSTASNVHANADVGITGTALRFEPIKNAPGRIRERAEPSITSGAAASAWGEKSQYRRYLFLPNLNGTHQRSLNLPLIY